MSSPAPDEYLQQRLQRIEQNLNQVGSLLVPSEISEGIKQAIILTSMYADSALASARKVLDFIASDLYMREFKKSSGTQPLENTLQQLLKADKLPKRLATYASSVRELGNLGVHGLGKEVTQEDVVSSLENLMKLVAWYCEKVRPGAPPERTPAELSGPSVIQGIETQYGQVSENTGGSSSPASQQGTVQSRQHHEQAANQGDCDAMYELGLMYKTGKGVAQDYTLARHWFEKSAAAGVSRAMFSLGLLSYQGEGIAQNYAQARQWFEKAAAAAGDSPWAKTIGPMFCLLGHMCKFGQGGPKDYGQARQCFEEGANLGNSTCMFELAVLYARGEGVAQDYTQALQWYEKSAAAGNIVAMLHLGSLYCDGESIVPDYAKGWHWLESAAGAGDSRAMYCLGVAYYEGSLGVVQDYPQARQWFEKAAAAASTKAMNMLSTMYEKGQGVPQDNEQARQWSERAKQAVSKP